MTTSYDTVYETQANVTIIKYNYQNALRKSQGTKEYGKRSIALSSSSPPTSLDTT